MELYDAVALFIGNGVMRLPVWKIDAATRKLPPGRGVWRFSKRRNGIIQIEDRHGRSSAKKRAGDISSW